LIDTFGLDSSSQSNFCLSRNRGFKLGKTDSLSMPESNQPFKRHPIKITSDNVTLEIASS
jgi:hypothetical protein